MPTLRTAALAVLLLGTLALVSAGAHALTTPYVISEPLLEQHDLLLASDGDSSHRFGSSIAASGSTAVIGAPGWNNNGEGIYIGSAYVFTANGTGWKQTKQLIAGDHAIGDTYGSAVALDGDAIVIGAPGDNKGQPGTPGFEIDTGSVYVYTGSDANWTLQTQLAPDDLTAQSFFGSALALDGDTLVVSAGAWTRNAQSAVYIFKRSGSTWTQQARLLPDAAAPGSFGQAVAVAGDVALVAAPGYSPSDMPTEKGIVYLYRRSGATWSPAGTLKPDPSLVGDEFGCAIDFDGQTAVIAACEAYGAETAPGWAYVFVTDGTNWAQQARLQPAGASDITSVSLLGDRVALGAPFGSGPVADYTGAVYLYNREDDSWAEDAAVQAQDSDQNDQFGSAVALTGEALLIGAPQRPHLNRDKQGAVYLFGPKVVLNHAVNLPLVLRPAPAAAGGLIAYSSYVDYRYDIVVSETSGGGATNLTKTADASETGVSWSPDGRRLAFSRSRPGEDPVLVILTLDGGSTTVIPTTLSAYDPSWSPDGKTIAFVGNGRETNHDYEIYTIGIDGKGQKRLTNRFGEDSEPDWSPDGKRIVFRSVHSNNSDLKVMNADGSGQVFLTETADSWENTPAWSPDGSKILFMSGYNDEESLFTMPAAGGAARLVLTSAMMGRWSPDGAKIVFTGTGGGVFTANADGSNVRTVDADSEAALPDWQPGP